MKVEMGVVGDGGMYSLGPVGYDGGEGGVDILLLLLLLLLFFGYLTSLNLSNLFLV